MKGLQYWASLKRGGNSKNVPCLVLKSVNLQYITLGCLDDGTNKSSTRSLMFQVLILYNFIDLVHSKLFISIFVILWKNKKINWKDFCKEFLQEIMKKIILWTSDAWSTICLSHRPSDQTYYIVDWRISSSDVPPFCGNTSQYYALVISLHILVRKCK